MIKQVTRYLVLLSTLGQLLPVRSFAMQNYKSWDSYDLEKAEENVFKTIDGDFFRGGLKNIRNSCYVNTALQILSQSNDLIYKIVFVDTGKLKDRLNQEKIKKFKAVQYYFQLLLEAEKSGKNPTVSRAAYVAILKALGHQGKPYEVESIISTVFEGLDVYYGINEKYIGIKGEALNYIPLYLDNNEIEGNVSLASLIENELKKFEYKKTYLRFDYPLIEIRVIPKSYFGEKPCLKNDIKDFEELFISVEDDKKGIYVEGEKKELLPLELKAIAINTGLNYETAGHWISISRHRKNNGVISYWLHDDDRIKKLEKNELQCYLKEYPIEGMSFFYSEENL